jgi:hypothetical protein
MVSAGRYLPTGRHLYGGTYDEGGKLLRSRPPSFFVLFSELT